VIPYEKISTHCNWRSLDDDITYKSVASLKAPRPFVNITFDLKYNIFHETLIKIDVHVMQASRGSNQQL